MTTGFARFDVRTIQARADLATEPVLIVSADSHVTLPAHDYVSYLDPGYREAADLYYRDVALWQSMVGRFGYPPPQEELDAIDTRHAISAGGEIGYFDPQRRMRETEAEGVVAEILHPLGPLSPVPFYDAGSSLARPELRAAGARAHNRFLKEFCAADPDRLLGVYMTYPWPDMTAAVRDCEVARNAGGRAVFPAQQAGIPGDHAPALFDPVWDPFWAACQDLGLVVHIHAGWGLPQGGFDERYAASIEVNPDAPLGEVFDTFNERRPLWQLMWGGVFDKFPHLRIAFMEIHCDWVPQTLAYLDARYAADKRPMRRTPSEYWERHFAVGASLMRYSDVAARHDVGVTKVMFGTDYPHREGTWPNTHDWIRTALGQLPEDEFRLIMGGNAIRFYGLNESRLKQLAGRYGPSLGDLLGDHPVDERILRSFNDRAGIGKTVEVHQDELARALEQDIQRMNA